MTIQTINLGVAPTGAGGDTFRSSATKTNENFTNPAHAASRQVGTANGNVMEVGAFGIGRTQDNNLNNANSGFFHDATGAADSGSKYRAVIQSGHAYAPGTYRWQIGIAMGDSTMYDLRARIMNGGVWSTAAKIWSEANTTIDANGFIKKASPIVQLFADRIEPNEEALEQEPLFEKVDIGHYLIKNTEGFAKEGWWIEVPTDTNGNKICAVEYQTLENGDIEIKTFKKKLNEDGDIVANLGAPIDIPSNSNGESRWIDIRLHVTPKPIIHRIPRTEKQPKLVQQIKYAPQMIYIMSEEDMKDDDGKLVVVGGQTQKIQKPYIQTDFNGTPILQDQPVIDEFGQVVYEWVHAIDSEGKPIFEDIPVLDGDGNQIMDEVSYGAEQ